MASSTLGIGRKSAKLLLILLLPPLIPASAAVDKHPTDIEVAVTVFRDWADAYASGDFEQQWRLTDPRIRYWHPLSRWKKRMKAAIRHDGPPDRYDIMDATAVTGEQLPCTEQRHCFRHNVDYILLVIRSTYRKKQPPQPEFAVMARSEEGWRFGGGTFPFRPMGETMVILDEADELYYRGLKRFAQ